jgi:hypothetical protein
MYKITGEGDGQIVLSSVTTAAGAEELMQRPPNPEIHLDESGMIERIAATSFAKGRWTFDDGSALTALGLGHSNVVILRGGGTRTTEALTMVITNGTGRYDGAYGYWTINRAVSNPPGGTLIANVALDFTQKQIHTLRVTRGINLKMP